MDGRRGEEEVNPGLDHIKAYVPGRSVQEVLRKTGVAAVKMASNENPLGPCPASLDIIRRADSGISHYPEVDTPGLVAALSEIWNLSGEHFIVGNGADSIIYGLGMCLIDQSAEVVIPQPTFPVYATISHIMRGRVISSPLKDLKVDLDDVSRRITANTRMIWICNPNNPTGTLLDSDQISSFLKSIPDSVVVVHDEVYAEFAEKQLFPDTGSMIRGGRKNLFLLRSFSKIYGLAGLRIGYGVGDPELIRMLYRVRPPFDVSVIAQSAALAALEDFDFVASTLNVNQSGKKYLYSRFDKLGLRYVPTQTNFILVDVIEEGSVVCEILQRKGIIVRPMDSYGLDSYIRVTVGLPEQNKKFIRHLSELLSA